MGDPQDNDYWAWREENERVIQAQAETKTGEILRRRAGNRHRAECRCRICAPEPTVSKFWRFAEVSDGCWGWRGPTSAFGYGAISVGKTQRVAAHRFSYELHKGAIPRGMYVMHTCDNPPCTNPDHLVIGTPLDNSRDMWRKGRARPPAMKTHCVRGHAMSGDNVAFSPSGRRYCRSCHKIFAARDYQERKARAAARRAEGVAE